MDYFDVMMSCYFSLMGIMFFLRMFAWQIFRSWFPINTANITRPAMARSNFRAY
jgi:hypothetical protein